MAGNTEDSMRTISSLRWIPGITLLFFILRATLSLLLGNYIKNVSYYLNLFHYLFLIMVCPIIPVTSTITILRIDSFYNSPYIYINIIVGNVYFNISLLEFGKF